MRRAPKLGLGLVFLLASISVAVPNPFHCTLPLIRVTRDGSPFTMGVTETEFFLRKTRIGDGVWHESLKITEYDIDPRYKSVVLRREVYFDQPMTDVSGTAVLLPHLREDPSAPFQQQRMIREIVAKNLASYGRKRPHWSGEFKKHLARAAAEYANDSVYVAVLDKQTGKIVGNVRFIMAPYGIKDGKVVGEGSTVTRHYGPVSGFRQPGEVLGPESLPRPPASLPEETELGIKVDHPAVGGPRDGVQGGLKIEMGALFVDERLPVNEHQSVWGELWLHTLKVAQDSGHRELNYYGTVIHAYADPFSKRLYLPMGFELLRSYEHNGKRVEFGPEIADKDIPPIIKPDGSEWWPIVYRAENIDEYVRQWANGEVSRKDPEVARKRMEAFRLGDAEDRRPFTQLQADALLNSMVDDIEAYAVPAAAAVVDLIRMRRMHRERADGPDAARAKKALKPIDDSLSRLGPRLSETLKSPEPWRRKTVANTVFALLKDGTDLPDFSPYETIQKLVLPLLTDPAKEVRVSAVHQLRAAVRNRRAFRDMLYYPEETSESEVTLSLKAKGFSGAKLQRDVQHLAEFLDSRPFWEAYYGDPEQSEIQVPVDRALDAMAGKDRETVRQLLYLATHYQKSKAPLEALALNGVNSPVRTVPPPPFSDAVIQGLLPQLANSAKEVRVAAANRLREVIPDRRALRNRLFRPNEASLMEVTDQLIDSGLGGDLVQSVQSLRDFLNLPVVGKEPGGKKIPEDVRQSIVDRAVDVLAGKNEQTVRQLLYLSTYF